jgi:hypothetical protein
MLDVYRRGLGRTRRELHGAVHALCARQADCPLRRIDAFCKLLDDAGTWSQEAPSRAAALRRQVFRLARERHPLVTIPDVQFPSEEQVVKSEIAAHLGRSWQEIDRQLFADIRECHCLASFAGYPSGEALLARYNVAQVQAALFRARDMTVWATDDLKTIVRYAKLARLMHTIRRLGDGMLTAQKGEGRYEMRFDGPASVLRHTQRYGVALAKFLPALLACRGWRLHAVLHTRRRGWLARLDLSPADGLTSHLPPPEEFDSRMEETFARRWGGPRDGWSLERESELLVSGQKVFTPDFVLRHDAGRRVLLEIVGFWTPEYLRAKFQTLEAFADQPILVAVAAAAAKRPDVPPGAIVFKTTLKPQQVLARLAGDA